MKARKIGELKSSGLVIRAIDTAHARSSATGRNYRIESDFGSLELSVAEWTAIRVIVERDMLRDAVPPVSRSRSPRARARRRAAR